MDVNHTLTVWLSQNKHINGLDIVKCANIVSFFCMSGVMFEESTLKPLECI